MRRSVLLVTTIFPPAIGGPATFIDRLAGRLAGLGAKVTVVCATPANEREEDHQRPFRVIRVSSRTAVRHHLSVRFHMFTEVACHRHILVNGLEAHAAQAARVLRRPVIMKVVGDTVWEHARTVGATVLSLDAFQKATPERLLPMIEARNQRLMNARCIVTPSEYLRQLVIGWGLPPERVVVIPNGVELAPGAQPSSRRLQEPLRALFVGRLTNWKGVDTLLAALVDLPEVEVSVIGDGPQLPALVALSELLGVSSRVSFLGPVDAAGVRAGMAAAHVLVLDSMYEGMSHTLLEAMASALPCIASDAGGNRELIRSGQDGVLVKPQNVGALRDALRALRDSEDRRQAIALGGCLRVRSWDIEATVTQFATLLEVS